VQIPYTQPPWWQSSTDGAMEGFRERKSMGGTG